MGRLDGAVTRGLVGGGAVRVSVVEATDVSREAARIHGLSTDASILLGECIVAGLLLSSHIKGEERLALQLQSERPRVATTCEVDAGGHVRARCSPPSLSWRPEQGLNGILLVIKSDARQELYRGHSDIRGGTMQDALGRHLRQSAQVDAILRLGALASPGGELEVVGGVLVERLPEEPGQPSLASPAFRERFGPMADQSFEDVMEAACIGLVGDEAVQVLGSRPVAWRCRCSRDKVEAMLGSLGRDTLRQMRDEDHGAEITCHFCEQVYRVSEARLDQLVELCTVRGPDSA